MKIDSKGLTGLEDQLQQEYLAAKKAMVYQNEMEDQQLKEICGQVAAHHRARYCRMMDYLNANG